MQELRNLVECYKGCFEEYFENGNYPSVGEQRHLDHLQSDIAAASEKAIEEFNELIKIMNEKRFDVKRFKWAFPNREAYNVSIKARDQDWGDITNSHWDSTLDEHQWELLSKYFGE